MNYRKLEGIMRVIERSGDLPRDQWGDVLGYEDLAAWFGLNEFLNAKELGYIKGRLAELAETQRAIEMMKLPQL